MPSYCFISHITPLKTVSKDLYYSFWKIEESIVHALNLSDQLHTQGKLKGLIL